jgi:glycosyltransferase involved in cell wall biosynthesis
VRIVTDIPALRRAARPGIEILCITTTSRWRRFFRILSAAFQSEYLLIEFSLLDVVFYCGILRLIPNCKCRVATLDLFVERVFSMRAVPRAIICRALRRVDRFLVYFRDTKIFEELFGAPADRFCYVPYKINGFELARKAAPSDRGYVFCGGRSRRDFATFFAAVGALGYPAKVVASRESELKVHGSTLSGLKIPANVELLQDNPSLDFFVETAAQARLVVLPILKDTVTQTGIGVYLMAMGLGKCVIISSGLGVSDVLTEGQAMIVPAGDAGALQDAIRQVWNDPDLRARYAEAGCRYATPLGGEERFAESILNALT